MMDEHLGKVQIFEENQMQMDLPESSRKSYIAVVFQRSIEKVQDFYEWRIFGSAYGYKYLNNRILSPDLCISVKERSNSAYSFQHLNTHSTAPMWILECEWLDQCHSPRKGSDKILNYYLNITFVGLNDIYHNPTRVEEAWLCAIELDDTIDYFSDSNKTKYSDMFLIGRIFDFLGYVFRVVLYNFDFEGRKTSLFGLWEYIWIFFVLISRTICYMLYDVIESQDNEPINLPYIAIYYKNTPYNPLYYPLRPNALFMPPLTSKLAYIRPIFTNHILTRV